VTHVDAPFPVKRKRKRERRSIPLWAETVVLLVIALLLAIFIKQFFVQAFYIPSGSMEPGLVPNDRILVEKWSYWMGSPRRGDIIVFSDPNDWLQGEDAQQSTNFVTSALGAIGLYPLGGHLVKRVIGVAGDHVDCDPKVDGGRVRINGYAVDETSYLPHSVVNGLTGSTSSSINMPSTTPCDTAFSAIVPAGDLWVMGDNRGDSSDSRFHMKDADGPFVPVKDVVGKVFAVIWPVGHMKLIHRPSVFDKVPAPATTASALPITQ
jgi:signal peptidase I